MKGFLIDENLPARYTVVPSLPVVSSSRAIRRSAADSDLWEFAREKELAIVTKDADFFNRIVVSTPPPWVVHVRFGNLQTTTRGQHKGTGHLLVNMLDLGWGVGF